jgi:predicted transcriptional regulator
MPAASIATITSASATVKDLLLYLYDLSPLDMEVFFLLLKSKVPMKLEELASKIDRDRTNIFRSLQKLVNLGLCIKDVKTLQNGGYYHIYSSIDIKTLKAELKERIEEIHAGLCRLLLNMTEDGIQKVIQHYNK